MTGNLLELGPYRVNNDSDNKTTINLEPNSGSWNRIFGLLFLDNPIGAGFSIASSPEEIPLWPLCMILQREPCKTRLVTEFLQSVKVKALGANASITYEDCNDLVGEALQEDVMKSVKYMVELRKVLLYQGNFDLRNGVVSTEAWVRTIKWEMEKFLMAERKVWKVNGVLAGYVQTWKNLSHAVLGAGHFMPTDQALNSKVMIRDLGFGQGRLCSDLQS